MVHEQLLYTHTKPSWLRSLRSGRTKYKAVNCSDRKVRVFDEVALITGRAAIEAEIGGQLRSLKLLFRKVPSPSMRNADVYSGSCVLIFSPEHGSCST